MINVHYKTIIVGGGPLGLYFASKVEELGENYLLLEATSTLGGQIPKFYPKKPIVDIDEFDVIEAIEYINVLKDKISMNNVMLNTEIVDIVDEEDFATVTTKTGEKYSAQNVIIAIGLGFPKSKPLGLPNDDKYDNILYSLKSYDFMAGKKVAIFGGGDSALDWARNLSDIADEVSLVHRRNEFRGDAKTIEGKTISLYLSYVPSKLIEKDGKCIGVTISSVPNPEETKDLYVDYILVNFGTLPSTTPLNFPRDAQGYIVDENYRVSKHIFAIGDIASYPNKKRRIQPGINEANIVLKVLN